MKRKYDVLEVPVRQKHIDKGKQHDPWKCAVARAIQEKAKAKFVSVDAYSIELGNGTNVLYLDTPAAVAKFIDKFDASRNSVKPFTFKLRIPIA